MLNFVCLKANVVEICNDLPDFYNLIDVFAWFSIKY